MSKKNTEKRNPKIRMLSRNPETLHTVSAESLQGVIGGNTPSIPIPPPDEEL
jgi:hypothetical protein